MLCNLIFLILFSTLSVFASKVQASFGKTKACQESPVKGTFGKRTPCNSELYKNNFSKSNPFNGTPSNENEVLNFQKESLQKVETLLQDHDFQSFVTELQDKLHDLPNSHKSKDKRKPQGELLIFVSFSMGEKALLNLAEEAKRYGAILVLRGFLKGSYRKTVYALQKTINKTQQGFIVDPELYTLFSIQAVPTFIISKPFQLNASERTQTPLHDRLQGHVSVHYALETFSKDGDMKKEVQILLERGEKS